MVLARRRGRRRLVGIGLGLAGLGALAGCGVLPFQAWSAGRVHRLGYLRAETPPPGDIEGFRRGLREQGYVEGETVVVEYRWADGDLGRLRALATELVDVDVIVASAPDATRVAKEATATTPIVMVLVADPVAFGFVDGLARPGGNPTGFAYLLPELSGERLELLAQAVRGCRASRSCGSPPMRTSRWTCRKCRRRRRPDRAGGSLHDRASGADRRPGPAASAAVVDKILRGASPADLPVERPTAFEFVVNLQAAHAIGFTSPQSVLQQATEIIQ